METTVMSKKIGCLKVLKEYDSLRNDIYLVASPGGGNYVYKRLGTKTPKPDPLTEEIKFLGADVKHRRRSAKEIAEFSRKITTLGLATPQIVEVSKNYTIEKYIEGRNFLEIKNREQFEKVAKRFLNAIHHLHRNDLIAGDRWYNSQIVDEKSNIFLIDFDLAFEGQHLAELEMAETLNALIYQRGFEETVFVAESFIQETTQSYNYNIDIMVEILEKHIEYWDDPEDVIANLIKILARTG